MSTRSLFIVFASIASAPTAVIGSLNSKIAYVPKKNNRKRKNLPTSTSTTLSSTSSSDTAVINDSKHASVFASLPTVIDTDEVLDDANEPLVELLNDFPKKKEWAKQQETLLHDYQGNGGVQDSHTPGRMLGQGKHRPAREYPLPHELNRSGFGQPSLNHWFSQQGCFDHAMFFLIKNDWRDKEMYEKIFEYDAAYAKLRDLIATHRNVDFWALRDARLGYAEQTEIPEERTKMFTAALIHYDLDPALVIRFVQGELTAEHRDIDGALAAVKGLISDADYAALERVYRTGCPHEFKVEITTKQKNAYSEYGNHGSLDSNAEKVKKTMNKEERNSHLITVESLLLRFMSKASPVPNALVVGEGKNDRLVWDGSFRIAWNFWSINDMTNTDDEPEISYGTTAKDQWTWIYNLRITYPKREIYLGEADVKACHRQPKLHLDIVGAFCFVIGDILMIPIGNVFGGTTSGSSWEPMRRAIIALATKFSMDPALIEKHREFIDMIGWLKTDDESAISYVQAVADSIHKGVLNEDGSRKNNRPACFVDDLLFADIENYILGAVAGCLEAVFVILGYPMPAHRQIMVAMDKLKEMVLSHRRTRLGLVVDTRAMTVAIPDPFVTDVLHIIATKWHSSRKAVTLDELEELGGKLGHIAQTGCEFRFLLAQTYGSITYMLGCNTRYLEQTDKVFRQAIKDAKAIPNIDDDLVTQRISYAKMIAARSPHQVSHQRYRICKSLREEIDLIAKYLSDDSIPISSPIAHLIKRDPTFQSFGDASLLSGGGYSVSLTFWWFVAWPEEILQRTLLNLKDNKDGRLISINVLEYAVVIITLAAAFTAAEGLNHPDPHPMLLNMCDNISASGWSKKGCTKNAAGKALSRLCFCLMIDSPFGLESEWISTLDNFVADDISRLKKDSDIEHDFSRLKQDYPQLQGCRHFQPSAELLSWVMQCILTGRSPDLETVRAARLRAPGSLGSFATS